MDTKLFEDYQKQMMDLQKKWFDTWMEGFPGFKSPANLSEGFDQTLKLQEDMIKSYLETQKHTTQVMLDSQTQIWTEYFNTMRKSVASVN